MFWNFKWNLNSQLRIRRGRTDIHFNGPSWALLALAVLASVLMIVLAF